MIPDTLYKSIGLTDEQTRAIKKALKQEQQYKDILRRAGVMPAVIDKVAAQSDTSSIDEIGEAALIEMIKDEWAAFIPSKDKKTERRF